MSSTENHSSTPTLGQQLAAKRWSKRGELNCAQCGRAFDGVLSTPDGKPRYCTLVCRQRAWRKNHPGSRTQLKLRKMERDRNTI